MFKDHIYFIAWEELKKSNNNNNNNCKVAEKTMTRISKVRSIIIISISNPSACDNRCFHVPSRRPLCIRLPYTSKNYDVHCPSSNLCGTLFYYTRRVYTNSIGYIIYYSILLTV